MSTRPIVGGMVPDAEITVGGTALDPEKMRVLLEVKVVDSLTLPDACTLKFEDPGGRLVDSGDFDIGKEIEVKLALGERATTSVFKGEVASVSSDFGREGATMAVRAYDKMYKLQQAVAVKTYQNVTVGDAVRQAVSNAGVGVSLTVEGDTGGVQDFIQQSAESAYDFAWRLARRIDFELCMDGDTLKFRPANGGENPEEIDPPLRYGETLIGFRPRMTTMQQPESATVRGWDPKSHAEISGTKASLAPTDLVAEIGHQRRANGDLLVADRTITTQDEANQLAEATLMNVGNNTIEAEGTARGNPKLKAGKKIKIEGVGTKFGGKYVLSSVTHVFRGKKGYETHFVISGRTPRTLLDLMQTQPPESWGTQCVIGIVTNNDDPEKMGRVRVKYPALSANEEGWWARLTTLHAGDERGMLMKPQPDDEVAVVFENGDTRRPIVIGCMFHGTGKPDDQKADADGSLWVKSKKHIKTESTEDTELHSVKNFKITSDADLEVKVTGNGKEEVSGNVDSNATGNYTIKGTGTVTVESSAQLNLKAPMVSIEGQSMVQIKGASIQLG